MAATTDPHANRPAMQGGQPMAAAVANGGATLPPQQQQQPAAALAPASVSTATAIAALQPRTGYGFTPQQLVVLKHQILAFRNLKVRNAWASICVSTDRPLPASSGP
jgi:QLQ